MMILSILLAAPALAGCEADAEAAATAIAARIEVAEAAVLARDIDTYAGVFTEDTFQAGPGAPPLEGRAALHAAWTQQATFGTWQFDLEPIEVWACGDTAVERGYGELSFEPGEAAPPGLDAFTDRAHYIAHWLRGEDGIWRIRSEAVTSLPPAVD